MITRISQPQTDETGNGLFSVVVAKFTDQKSSSAVRDAVSESLQRLREEMPPPPPNVQVYYVLVELYCNCTEITEPTEMIPDTCV